MIEDINEAALVVDDREHICPACHLVHWTATGPSFCELT